MKKNFATVIAAAAISMFSAVCAFAATPVALPENPEIYVIGDDPCTDNEFEGWYRYYADLFDGTVSETDPDIIFLMDSAEGDIKEYELSVADELKNLRAAHKDAMILYSLEIDCEGEAWESWEPYDEIAEKLCDELDIVYAPAIKVNGTLKQKDLAESMFIYTCMNIKGFGEREEK